MSPCPGWALRIYQLIAPFLPGPVKFHCPHVQYLAKTQRDPMQISGALLWQSLLLPGTLSHNGQLQRLPWRPVPVSLAPEWDRRALLGIPFPELQPGVFLWVGTQEISGPTWFISLTSRITALVVQCLKNSYFMYFEEIISSVWSGRVSSATSLWL